MDSTGSKPRRAIRFVNISRTEARERASKHRSTIRSHAARVTHAMTRQARVIQYQLSKAATTQQQQPQRIEKREYSTNRELQETTQNATHEVPGGVMEHHKEALVMAGLGFIPGVPGSQRGDPFTSFAIPISPTDYLLLSHCEYGPVK
jgi:hypothetical protein